MLLNDFTNATQNGLVLSQLEFPSTNAKFSKSKSMPSKLFAKTKSFIAVTAACRPLSVDNKFESTNLSVPSVMVGIIVRPALFIVASGVEIGTLGFAGEYKSVIDTLLPVYLRVYQKGITSRIKSMLFNTAGNDVFIE